MNIVVVEDNDNLRETVVELLREQGHSVRGLDCAEDLDDAAGQAAIDLLVVDLNLPGEDGLSLTRRLRRAQPGLRVLMMTSRRELLDKVRGYESGADIYLTKPMSLEELTAAVQALGRQLNLGQGRAETGPMLTLRTVTQQAQGPAGTVKLNADEVALLCALARATDQRLGHWQLLESMALNVSEANLGKLRLRMMRLRNKLAALGFGGPILQALRGDGYQLCLTTELH
jgi:DNA-binding response OmpR family regulator